MSLRQSADASEFHRRGDVSILRLAEDSDYRAHQTAIGVEDFQQYSRPTGVGRRVDVYSDTADARWVVFRSRRSTSPVTIPAASRSESRQFDDGTQACAAFIQAETDS